MEPPGDAVADAAILIVDDNEAIRRLLVGALRDMAGCVATAATVAEARRQLTGREFDVVITDISLPDEDGIDLMRWGRQASPGTSWMVLTGHASLDVAVRALQLGAFDFITKPLENVEALRHTCPSSRRRPRRRIHPPQRPDAAWMRENNPAAC